MAKSRFEIIDKDNRVAIMSFGEEKAPTIKKDTLRGFLKWGKDNDFPQELVRYADEQAEHKAIINSKSRYLWGKGLKTSDESKQILFDMFYDQANRSETWDDIGEKISRDCETFNGFFLQVVTNIYGKPVEFYHLQMANCRLDETGCKLYYSNDFTKGSSAEITTYNKYEEGNVGVFFIYFKYYTPAKNKLDSIYPKVTYSGCLSEIKSDIDITTFDYSYVKNGFSAGTIITFFNGEPSPEDKRAIKQRLTETHASPDKAGSIVINYADKGGQAAEIKALTVDDLDKKFETISERYKQKIVTGHNVTNPELFGIKTDGALGQRVNLRDSHELFLNTYTKPRQEKLKDFIENLYYLVSGMWLDLEFQQLEPIGYDLSADPDLTQDERRELKGYKPLNPAPTQTTNIQQSTAPATPVNSILTGLKGREMQNLLRIVRQFKSGKLNEQQAMLMITQGFGLSDQDAKNFLEITPDIQASMSKQISESEQEAYALELFSKCSIESKIDCEVLFEEEVHFHSQQDVLKYELKAMRTYMADALNISVTDLDNAVLSTIKGNPTLTVDEIAKSMSVDAIKVSESIARLVDKGLVESVANAFEPTEKALSKDTSPLDQTEIITVYKYAKRSDAPSLLPGGTSRDFCKQMMAMSQTREWTFDAISSITDDLGMNAWDYRGGFYTNPNTGETTPWCRHIWKAQTKIVKKS